LIKQLTGIRAILAWWVVCLHILCNPQMVHYFWFARLFSRGNLAVDGFFVLSGFILCHVYAAGLEEFSARRYLAFLAARIARVYPVHLVVLIAFLPALAANRWFHLPNAVTGFSALDLGLSLLLVQAWGFVDHPAWNSVAWSVSAEWFAYLLFPAFLFVVVKGNSLLRLVAVTAASLLALVWVSFAQADANGPAGLYRSALVMVCANFALGCAVYVAKQERMRTQAWMGTAAAAAAIVCAACRWLPLYSFSFAVLILALSSDGDWLSGMLARKAMVYLGETSYSVYMVHLLVWEAIAMVAGRAGVLNAAGAPYVAGVAMMVITAASSLSYHLVEVPARRYFREFVRVHFGLQAGEETGARRERLPVAPRVQEADARTQF
jgi:peptidoglycan/LPS O-acetylase OafA/YrhL